MGATTILLSRTGLRAGGDSSNLLRVVVLTYAFTANNKMSNMH